MRLAIRLPAAIIQIQLREQTIHADDLIFT